LRFSRLDTQQLLADPSQQLAYGYVAGNALAWNDQMGLGRWKDFKNGVKKKYDKFKANRAKKKADKNRNKKFKNSKWNFREVETILSSTPIGKKLLEMLPSDILIKPWSSPQAKGTLAKYDNEFNTIYLDPNKSSLDVAPLLAHEIVHSIQDDYRENSGEVRTNDSILDDEVAAKKAEYQSWSELGKPETKYNKTMNASEKYMNQGAKNFEQFWRNTYKAVYFGGP